jgi:hypothetical protein
MCFTPFIFKYLSFLIFYINFDNLSEKIKYFQGPPYAMKLLPKGGNGLAVVGLFEVLPSFSPGLCLLSKSIITFCTSSTLIFRHYVCSFVLFKIFKYYFYYLFYNYKYLNYDSFIL